MPVRTLWRAMNSVRRPVCTASATRSIRSTVITASAVWEEIVAPAPAAGETVRAAAYSDRRVNDTERVSAVA